MDKAKELEKKIKRVEAGLDELLRQEKLELEITLDFPKYRELPDEVVLALKVMENHGGVVIKKYTPRVKKKTVKKKVKK